ncbi:hypothetical protein [uncultured Bacteroides sp.]|uniref:hypothetical protein n=1 Tax=uncultured Bacteroides sp. TaxID=162156 RepID=UPI002637A8D8|nr:hypothetical protein [uncultured Bacteroides sp.]
MKRVIETVYTNGYVEISPSRACMKRAERFRFVAKRQQNRPFAYSRPCAFLPEWKRLA